MPTPTEVAYKFAPAFFEELATAPENLAGMYGSESALMLVDFECGTKKVYGADIAPALVQWANIIQNCQLTVGDVSVLPFHSGVCIHLTLVAESASVRHFFQFVTNLEEYPAGDYGPSSFYIRNQIVTRTGAVEKEPSCAEGKNEPEGKVEEEEPLPEPETTGTPVVEKKEDSRRAPNKKPDGKGRVSPSTAAPAVTEAAVDAPTGPKTWASLASIATKGEQRPSIKVVANESTANKVAPKPASPPTKQAPQSDSRKQVSPKRAAKAPRAPSEPVGERLMFSIDHAVTDEEILTALGPLAARIVSLRNNSTKGYVFFDFSPGEDSVMDSIKAAPFVVGASQTTVNVFRQKQRS